MSRCDRRHYMAETFEDSVTWHTCIFLAYSKVVVKSLVKLKFLLAETLSDYKLCLFCQTAKYAMCEQNTFVVVSLDFYLLFIVFVTTIQYTLPSLQQGRI